MLWMVRKMLSRRAVLAGKYDRKGNGIHTNSPTNIGANIGANILRGIGGYCRRFCPRICHSVGFWVRRPRLLWLHVSDMLALRRSRRQLADLAPHRRADIGVTAAEVEEECRASLLGEISPWASLELRAAVRDSRRPSTPPPRYERSFYRARGRGDLPGSG